MAARRRANPGALAIFGNPRVNGTASGDRAKISETQAWRYVLAAARQLRSGILSATVARDTANGIMQTADHMLAQLGRGVHVNPRGGECMSKHVQAIAYVHQQDGDAYVHGFGDAELNAKQLNKGILDLSDLKDLTDVCMYANKDGSLTLRHAQGKDLTALFD